MNNSRSSVRAQLRQESLVDFMSELHTHGVDLDQKFIDLLVRNKRINVRPENEVTLEPDFNINAPNMDYKSNGQRLADSYIDIVTDVNNIPGAEENKRHIVMDTETYHQISDSSLFTYNAGRIITIDDWKPKNILEHSDEFIHWINSINKGFQYMTPYKPFQMYCQQAKDWLEDTDTIYDYPADERKEFAFREMERCGENTLYFMDKYLQLKEGDMNSGNMKYLSKPVHKVICFMIDAGYSMIIGKPRQIAATSTLGGIALCKTITRRNFFLKMVAQDELKTIEIFDDKIKYPFSELPNFMKPEVGNDRDKLLRFSSKTEKKGSKGGTNSKIQVVAPSVAAINGGSPQLVLIDEAGYIRILGKMIKEARPTMFMQDPVTGKLKMTRQIVVWGTGGEVDAGGKSFETEFRNNLKLWNDGVYTSGMIPLFFDWTTRPGITKEHYLNEKRVYTVEGPDKEEKAVQFRQAYPSVIDDMFLTSYKLLVGASWINEQIERIQKTEHKFRPIAGYFEPVFDYNAPENENSDVPFKIIGAKFIPCDDDDIGMASCWLLQEPKKGWRNRYYKGTDPIMTDNGLSKMASAVWDSVFNAPVAIMNYRNQDHKATFLQNLLLGIYFDTEDKKGIPELVEANIGTAYFDYVEAKGFYRSLVQKTELIEFMQGGGQLYGIDNKGIRNEHIIAKMKEMFTAFGDRCFFRVAFEQLKTFICKINDKGNHSWGVTDPRNFSDDVLFAMVFSYICALSYSHRQPISIEQQNKNVTFEYRLVRDKRGNLTRQAVRRNG